MKRDSQLRAQLKALEAVIKADNAERRAAEAPLREARRELARSVHNAHFAAGKWHAKVSGLLYDKALGMFTYQVKLTNAEAHLADTTATFRSRLTDLQAFDAIHNIVNADYPSLPELDRSAIAA